MLSIIIPSEFKAGVVIDEGHFVKRRYTNNRNVWCHYDW